MVESPIEKKKSPILFIAIGIVLVLIIGLCLWFFVFNKPNEENGGNNNNSQGGNEKSVDSVFDSSKFNGIYTYGFSSVKLYAVTKDIIKFSITGSDRLSNGEFKYSNGIGKYEFMDLSVTIKMDSSNLIVESNSNSFISGTYTKSSDYTANEYFKDNFGNDEYFNSKYNGKYINDKENIYVYQSDQNTITVFANLTNNIYIYSNLQIKNEEMAIGNSEVEEYNLTLNDNKIIFVIKSSGNEMYKKEFIRDSKITKGNVIEVFNSNN